ncbi:MAG: hypothetical protein HC829_01090 [Bacteroidales bacterium]|nr:hypothetical protein [Bacteroidales bacterium]
MRRSDLKAFDAATAHPDQVKSLDDIRRFLVIDQRMLRDRQLGRLADMEKIILLIVQSLAS